MKGNPSKQRVEDRSPAQALATGYPISSAPPTGTKLDLKVRLADPRLQKSLLRLHASMELEEVVKALFDLMNVAVPNYFVGVWFQLASETPLIIRTSRNFGDDAYWMRFMDPEINPSAQFWAAHVGQKTWRASDTFSDEAMRRLDFYREFIQSQGWHNGATIAVWKGSILLGGASAMRTLAQGDFTNDEMKLLLRLHPFVAAALKRLDRLHAERNARAAVEQLLRRLPLPTLLLDWELRLIHSNPSGKESCSRWNGGPEPAPIPNGGNSLRVPEPLLAACREMREQWSNQMRQRYAVASSAGQTVAHPGSPGLRASVHLVQRSVGSIAKPIFRIEFQPTPGSADPGVKRDLAIAARLTRRERDLVQLLCQGASNKEIADRLDLSIGTVKKELNTLYRKLEVQSRNQLMALMR